MEVGSQGRIIGGCLQRVTGGKQHRQSKELEDVSNPNVKHWG
jgi:hypothetical protein